MENSDINNTKTPFTSIVDIFIEPMTMSDCEHRVEYVFLINGTRAASPRKVYGSLACVFDLSNEFVADLINLGKVYFAQLEKGCNPNYCQFLSMDCNRMMIFHLLYFLVKEKDENSHSHFNMMQQSQLQFIASKYETADKYFECVSERLWQDKEYLSECFGDQLILLRKRLRQLEQHAKNSALQPHFKYYLCYPDGHRQSDDDPIEYYGYIVEAPNEKKALEIFKAKAKFKDEDEEVIDRLAVMEFKMIKYA